MISVITIATNPEFSIIPQSEFVKKIVFLIVKIYRNMKVMSLRIH
jgi:hypothetical protein